MNPIEVRLGEHKFAINLLPQIKREALHGKSTLTPMKGDTVLKRAYLRPNGQIVKTSDRKLADCDPEGSVVEKPTSASTTEAGPTELKPATTEAGFDLVEGKPTEIAEYAIDRFLPVEIVGIPAGIYHTSYSSKPTVNPEAALLIVKSDSEAFLLIGERRPSIFVGDIPNYDFFGQEAKEDVETDDDPLSVSF